MALSTILSAGVTSASSSDIVVGVGEAITVGVFSAAADNKLPSGAELVLIKTTPGAINEVFRFGDKNRQKGIFAPGTYRVDRAAYSGSAFGVFTDDGAA